MTDNINMGGTSVFTKTQGIKFADGTEQDTAANTTSQSLQTGVAIFTGGSSSTVVFGTPYTGASAPTVVVSPVTSTHGLAVPSPSSVVVAGTSGAWTGFTLYLSGTLFGSFNWIAVSN